jgi:cytochrome c-type biogenesis protein CcmH/NrfG
MPVSKRTASLSVLLLILVPTGIYVTLRVQESARKARDEFAAKMTESTTALLQQEKYPEARQAAQQWTQVQPDSGIAWRELGIAALGTGDLQTAQPALEKAVTMSPQDSEAQVVLGNIYFKKKDFSKAETAYRTGVKLTPDSPDAMLGLARALIVQNKDLPEAETCATKAANANSGSAFPYFTLTEARIGLRKGPEAKVAVNRGLALDPANPGGYDLLARVDDLLGDASAQAKAATLAEAIRQYKPGAPDIPDPVRVARGEALLEEEHYKEALGEFILVARHDITNAGALEGAGIALWQLNAKATASAYLKEALRLDPDRVRAGITLGVVAYENGLYEGAIRFLKRVTEVQPRNALAWHALGQAYVARQLHDIEAEAALRQATSLDEKNPVYLMDLADALKTNGKLAEAEVMYRRALALAPSEPETCARFGAFLAQLPPDPKNRSEAQTLLETALKSDPTYSFCQYQLGRLFVEEEKYAEGVPLLEKATANGNGRTKDVWSVLARAYRNLGQREKEATALATADKIQQEHDRYDRAVERLSSNLNDPGARLEMARASAERGEMTRALAEYASYLRHVPGDKAVAGERDQFVMVLKAAGKYPDMDLYYNLNTSTNRGK